MACTYDRSDRLSPGPRVVAPSFSPVLLLLLPAQAGRSTCFVRQLACFSFVAKHPSSD